MSDTYLFLCQGSQVTGSFVLNGLTASDPGGVNLLQEVMPSGTKWALSQNSDTSYTIQCLGDIIGPHTASYLHAHSDGTVDLAATPATDGSTSWSLIPFSNNGVSGFYVQNSNTQGYLNGITKGGTVDWLPNTEHSGTEWMLVELVTTSPNP